MALDGITLFALACELNNSLVDCKIEKVSQPTRDEIVLAVRKKGFNHKLLINISSNSPRIHFLNENRENPKIPPMFCMLLRKHLTGSTITKIETLDFERLIKLELLGYDEMGFRAKKYLIIEMLGKFSNLILTNEEMMIIDCAKRVDFESSTRPVLPNIFYEYPPSQDKISILDDINSITLSNKEDIYNKIKGISPLVAGQLYSNDAEILNKNLLDFKAYIKSENFEYYMLYKDGQPVDFSMISIDGFECKQCENLSFILCDFFESREKANSLKSVHKELLKTVKNLISRQKKKTLIQQKELEDTQKRDIYKNYGDLIVSNLYNITDEKCTSLKVIDYYDENMPEIEIPMDITLSPKQNSDKYFLKYNKLKTAEEILITELKKGEINLVYLESILESIERTQTTDELLEIKTELSDAGFVKISTKNTKKVIKSVPTKFMSSDGFVIYAGKNNIQNDFLTLKTANKTDLWFHTQKIHGTHVILINDGRDIPEQTMLECAMISAYNSKAKNSSNVPVDFCPVSHVKKPRGAKPGMVIYDNYNTIYITPDAKKIEEMRVK